MAEWYTFSELVQLMLQAQDTGRGVMKPMDNANTIEALRNPEYVRSLEIQLRQMGHDRFRYEARGNYAIAIYSQQGGTGKIIRIDALESTTRKDRSTDPRYLQADEAFNTAHHRIEIMEHAPSLTQLVNEGKISRAQAAHYVEQVERALAHDGKIVFDLRSGDAPRIDNIGLTKDGIPVILDGGAHPVDADSFLKRMRESGMDMSEVEQRYHRYRSEPAPNIRWPEIEPRRTTPATDVAHGSRYPFPGPDPIFGNMDIKPVEAAIANIRRAVAEGRPISASDARAVVEWSVHNFRSEMNDRLARIGSSIHTDSLRGACGNVPDLVTHALRQLGVAVNSANMQDIAHLDRPTHQVATISFPVEENGRTRTVTYLIDPTFRQFLNPHSHEPDIRRVGERLTATPEGARIANQILRHGYIELTPEVAAHYARAFNPALTPDQLKTIAASYTNPDFDHPPSRSQVDYLRSKGVLMDLPGHAPEPRAVTETERPRGLRMPGQPEVSDASVHDARTQRAGRGVGWGGVVNDTVRGNYLGAAIGTVMETWDKVAGFFGSRGAAVVGVANPVLLTAGTSLGFAHKIHEAGEAYRHGDIGEIARHSGHGYGLLTGGLLLGAGMLGVGAATTIGAPILIGVGADMLIDTVTGGYSPGRLISAAINGSIDGNGVGRQVGTKIGQAVAQTIGLGETGATIVSGTTQFVGGFVGTGIGAVTGTIDSAARGIYDWTFGWKYGAYQGSPIKDLVAAGVQAAETLIKGDQSKAAVVAAPVRVTAAEMQHTPPEATPEPKTLAEAETVKDNPALTTARAKLAQAGVTDEHGHLTGPRKPETQRAIG